MKAKFKNLTKLVLFLSLVFNIFILNTFAQDKNKDINSKISKIVKNTPNFTPKDFKVKFSEIKNSLGNVNYIQKEANFENGDIFSIFRFDFKETKENNFETSIKINGNKITFRYVNPLTNEWVNTSNINNLMNTTLFIDTDTNSYVVSIPAVYENNFLNSTLTAVPEYEKKFEVQKGDGFFTLKMSFPQNKNLIGEFWTIKSNERLVDWSKKESFDELLVHDLAQERRWSLDGYYFKTPFNYVPSGDNVFYKNAANYTGSSFVKYGKTNFAKNMGYLMTYVCMQNQNELGYWETGPKSLWLEKDFNIKEGFYDTRFSTDFAVSLLYAYQKYNNKEFLESALKYAEFFLDYANKNNYKIENGGILVQDYGYHKGEYENTHVSLNHQLAEINFLYRLYNITKEESYLKLADEMLLGIENTRNKWVLEDNNLNYALMYDKNTNLMIDYPYLTYNDLFETKQILKDYFNKTNETIEFLMASKKIWMDKNNIIQYLGYKDN